MGKNRPPISQPFQLRDHHVLLLLGAMLAFFFRDILLQNAWFWEDFLNQAYPFRTFAAASLAGGEMPLWNPYTFGGMPFQADIQSAVFYPPNLLLTFFQRDGRLSFYAMEVMLILHFWIAGACMYYLAREHALERAFAFFAALLYSLSGFMIAQAIHPAIVQQLAWLPLIVLLLHRALLRGSPVYVILCGLLLGASLLAGSPQATLYVVVFLILYAGWILAALLWKESAAVRARAVWMPVAVVAIAAGVAAIQLLPTMELRPLSQRAELTFEDAQYGRLALAQLLTAFVPKLFGETSAAGNTFWGPGGYGAYWESAFYVGIAGLLAAGWSLRLLRSNTLVRFLWVAVLIATLAALGDQFVLHRLMFDYVPGFSTFRGAGRIMSLATFALALLGALGLRAFMESARAAQRPSYTAIAGAAALFVLLFVFVRWRLIFPEHLYEPAIHAAASSAALTALAIAIPVLTVAALTLRGVLKPQFALALLFLLQFTDMNVHGSSQNNGAMSDRDYFDGIKPDVIRRLRTEAEGEYFRTITRNGPTMWLDRNHGMVERLFLLEGYTPLKLGRTIPPARDSTVGHDMMNAKYRAWLESNDHMVLRYFDTYLPRVWMVNQVVLRESDQVEPFMRSDEFNPRTMVVLEEPPSPPPDTTRAISAMAARITAYSLNSLSVKTAAPGNAVLVLSEIHYPGWQVFIDGQRAPLHRANWSLRAVAVPAGEHEVTLRFRPHSFALGAAFTLATIALCGTALILAARLHRRRGTLDAQGSQHRAGGDPQPARGAVPV